MGDSVFLRKLAAYYRDLLSQTLASPGVGRYFTDLARVVRYGLTADVGLFFEHPDVLFQETKEIRLRIERLSASEVTFRSDETDPSTGAIAEERPATGGDDLLRERRENSRRVTAIFRKQMQDPYNRETLLAYPLLAGKYGSVSFCGALLYWLVELDYDPRRDLVAIRRLTETPAVNSHLLSLLAAGEDEMQVVRERVLPIVYGSDLTRRGVLDILRMLCQLLEGMRDFHGVSERTSLADAIDLRRSEGCHCVEATVLVNVPRTNAFLLDDLKDLAEGKGSGGETVAEVFGPGSEPDPGRDCSSGPLAVSDGPLLFPLASNPSQDRVARLAERYKLVVVQGPPGTGKSQTIANLVCHLVAKGHTVLVTSYQNKALEVLTDKLPDDVPYLAMSVLRGDAASVNELRARLESFDAEVATKDLGVLLDGRERLRLKIEQQRERIAALCQRFTELKLIEKDPGRRQAFEEYDSLRDWDQIDPEDTVPPGQDEVVARALGMWWETVRELVPWWQNLVDVLGVDHCEIPERGRVLQEFVDLLDRAAAIDCASPAVRVACTVPDSELGAWRDLVASYRAWFGRWATDVARSLAALSDAGVPEPEFDELVRLGRRLGSSVLRELKEQAAACMATAEQLVAIGPPPPLLPSSSGAVLPRVRWAVDVLDRARRRGLGWYISPASWVARRELARLGVQVGPRATVDRDLIALRRWCDYWFLLGHLRAGMNHLRMAGVPVPDEVGGGFTELLRAAAIGRAYVTLALGACEVEELLRDAPGVAPVLGFLQSMTARLFHGSRPDELATGLHELAERLEQLTSYGRLRHEPVVGSLWEGWLGPLASAFTKLQWDNEARRRCGVLRELLRRADQYSQGCSLAATDLAPLRRTLMRIIELAREGRYSELGWLRDPGKVVKAFRFRKLISEDLSRDPDDINEVAQAIRREREELRTVTIPRYLTASRYCDLKAASENKYVRRNIARLRMLLGRKRKTTSLVQLREQTDFGALLQVFPCWIMSIDDVARVFPLRAGLFDYLIVDEASQCHQAAALPLAYRAKRMVVVGDSKQLRNPLARFVSDEAVKVLLSKHGLWDMGDVLHGRRSLLDVAEYFADGSVLLNEHFRCEPDIISWSNRTFYSNKLRILTPRRPKRFEPVAEVRMVAGGDEDQSAQVNEAEARAVLEEVRRLIKSGEAEGLTIGVISPFRPQADLIQNKLYEVFAEEPQVIRQYSLVASTADGFQGDERDIILYSFRYGPSSPPGSIVAVQNEAERLNVAFTRARRKVVCFVSSPLERFPDGLVRDFLRHVRSVAADGARSATGDRFDSLLEERVCVALRSRGLRVETQVPCGGFLIDLVVQDEEGRALAVECDGDFHYDELGELRPEDYQRQEILERAGWVVFRIPARRFYANPGATIDAVVRALKSQPPAAVLRAGDVTTEAAITLVASEVAQASPGVKSGSLERVAEAETVGLLPAAQPAGGVEDLPQDPEAWAQLARWGKSTGKLGSYHVRFCQVVSRQLRAGAVPAPQAVMEAQRVWRFALASGFSLHEEVEGTRAPVGAKLESRWSQEQLLRILREIREWCPDNPVARERARFQEQVLVRIMRDFQGDCRKGLNLLLEQFVDRVPVAVSVANYLRSIKGIEGEDRINAEAVPKLASLLGEYLDYRQRLYWTEGRVFLGLRRYLAERRALPTDHPDMKQTDKNQLAWLVELGDRLAVWLPSES